MIPIYRIVKVKEPKTQVYYRIDRYVNIFLGFGFWDKKIDTTINGSYEIGEIPPTKSCENICDTESDALIEVERLRMHDRDKALAKPKTTEDLIKVFNDNALSLRVVSKFGWICITIIILVLLGVFVAQFNSL